MRIKKHLLFWSMLFFYTILSVSCSDDDNNYTPGGNDGKEEPNFTIKVKNSVKGFVSDENDNPVTGALVMSGDKNTTTDEDGYFEIEDALVVKAIGVVTVEAENYFKGIRTWLSDADSEVFVRIKLIPKTLTGTFTASEGGDVKLSNGLTLSFPANAVVDKSTNQVYAGNVNVSMYWINPVSESFDREMPGDLTAVNSEGYLRTLVSYGMVAAELRGENNNELQISEGKSVKVTAPIEQEQLIAAPDIMPLWLFDEDKGLWIERGDAKKEGNTYVGEFDHFSYWNFDIPYRPQPNNISLAFQDEKGNPIREHKVLIEYTTEDRQQCTMTLYTNLSGNVWTRLPINSVGTIKLMSNTCVVYSKAIDLRATPDFREVIKIAVNDFKSNKVNISGTVTNCENQLIGDGYLTYKLDGMIYRVDVSEGKFEFPVFYCGESVPELSMKIYDYTSLSYKTVRLTDISGQTYVVDPIQICNEKEDIYIEFDVKGEKYVIVGDGDYHTYFWRNSNPNNMYPSSVSLNYHDPESKYGLNMYWEESNVLPVLGIYSVASVSMSLKDETYYQGYSGDAGFSATVTMTRYIISLEDANSYDVEGTFKINNIRNIQTNELINVEGKFKYKGIARPY